MVDRQIRAFNPWPLRTRVWQASVEKLAAEPDKAPDNRGEARAGACECQQKGWLPRGEGAASRSSVAIARRQNRWALAICTTPDGKFAARPVLSLGFAANERAVCGCTASGLR